MERRFRALTRGRIAAPKAWADAYLTAFAEASQVTLVTFDRAFRGKAKPVVLLEESDPDEQCPNRSATQVCRPARRRPLAL
jgi:hypothetical protein